MEGRRPWNGTVGGRTCGGCVPDRSEAGILLGKIFGRLVKCLCIRSEVGRGDMYMGGQVPSTYPLGECFVYFTPGMLDGWHKHYQDVNMFRLIDLRGR